MKKLYILIIFTTIVASINAQAPNAFNYQAILRNTDGTVKADETVAIQIRILHGVINGPSVYTELHNTQTNALGLVNLIIGSGTTSNDLSQIDWSNGPFYFEITVNGTFLGTSQFLSVPFALYSQEAGNVFSGAYNDLSDIPSTFNPLIHSHTESEISDLKHYTDAEIDGTESAFENWDKNMYNDFSGDYNDLTNIPSNMDIDRTDDVLLSGNQTISGEKTFSDSLFFLKDIDLNNRTITNVANPINIQDVATKAYVDNLERRVFEMEFASGMDSIVDIDGNFYKIVKIGEQYWMAENLKVTRFSDGTELLFEDVVWDFIQLSVKFKIPMYCWYDNDSSYNKNTYGALYNNYIGISHKNICPNGWHISTDEDWKELETYLGGDSIAGGMLKESGTAHWNSPNTGATNLSGFTALPGGEVWVDDPFMYGWRFIGDYGIWHSPTESSIQRGGRYKQKRLINTLFCDVFNEKMHGTRFSFALEYAVGSSIRCVKD